MHPIPPHEIRTPPPRFRGDPGIWRPSFCGPRSRINGCARSGPRRRTTSWGTWPPNASPPFGSTHLVGLAELIEEADRQLTICNACRYCEGYCAVFPALERRTLLSEGDITHLADLCHDCRACFTACMYAPPHEFGVNPPAVLSAVRRQ